LRAWRGRCRTTCRTCSRPAAGRRRTSAAPRACMSASTTRGFVSSACAGACVCCARACVLRASACLRVPVHMCARCVCECVRG
jgi:hypothetical protein